MATTGLSHPRAITPVNDPIHVRYEFNLFDRALIDSTYFQRLHFILQNSTNYISFPANKNTRFPHSMGVAHIAGRMFNSGLSQASRDDLTAFLGLGAEFIERLAHKFTSKPNRPFERPSAPPYLAYRKAHQATISGFSGFLHTPLLPKENEQRIDTEQQFGAEGRFTAAFVVDTFWQALRLYALMHDIGHLPMSHAFEVALSNVPNVMRLFGAADQRGNFETCYGERKAEFTGLPQAEQRGDFKRLFSELLDVDEDAIGNEVFNKAFHEIRGISIYNRFITEQSQVVPRNSKWRDASSIQKYATLIYHLSLSIILSSKSGDGKSSSSINSFLYAIKRIVDGEVDADRLDYTLRDCSEAGSQLGTYDLEQVVSNSLLVRDETTGDFGFGFYFRGVSGIEQFFEQRYSSYKYIIHHRTASRSNTCLEYLISLLFTYAFKNPQSSCAETLHRYGYLRVEHDEIKEILPDRDDVIERIDDASLRTMLFDLRQIFPAPLRTGRKAVRSSLEEQISICLDIVLLRRLEHVETAFKNERIDDVLRRAVGRQASDRQITKFTQEILNKPLLFWRELRMTLTEFTFGEALQPVGFLTEDISPKIFREAKPPKRRFEETVWIVNGPERKIALSDASASLRESAGRVVAERQIRVYLVSRDIKITPGLCKAIEDKILEHLAQKWAAFVRTSSRRQRGSTPSKAAE